MTGMNVETPKVAESWQRSVAALNLFYWFVTPLSLRQFGLEPVPLAPLLQAIVAVASVATRDDPP